MFAHTSNGKLIHITDGGKVTRCQKKIDTVWFVHEEPLAPGKGLHDCPNCGTPVEFENHRQRLRTEYERKQLLIAQAKAAQHDEAKAKASIAQDLAGQITVALKGLNVQANFARLSAGARVDATYKKNGHVFRFSFQIH